MAFDFPSNPLPDQTYSVGAITFKWNGYGWLGGATSSPSGPGEPGDAYTKAESNVRFVDAAGDTMTGSLTVAPPGGISFGPAADGCNLSSLGQIQLNDAIRIRGKGGTAAIAFQDSTAQSKASIQTNVAGTILELRVGANHVANIQGPTTGVGDITVFGGFTSYGTVQAPNAGLQMIHPSSGTQNGHVWTNWTSNVTYVEGLSGVILRNTNAVNFLQVEGANVIFSSFNNRIQADGWFIAMYNGMKPGGGDWADTSDARIKNVIGDYTQGLAAIKQLMPRRYTYKGNDIVVTSESQTPPPAREGYVSGPHPDSLHFKVAEELKEFVGLIAQQAETVMPEMVTQYPGIIDGQQVSDLRVLNSTPLLYALVNAVKELAARVEALEA